MKKNTLNKKKGEIIKKKATKSKIKLTNRTKPVKKKKNVTKKSIKNALTRKAKLTAKLSKAKKTTDLQKKRKKILKQTFEKNKRTFAVFIYSLKNNIRKINYICYYGRRLY